VPIGNSEQYKYNTKTIY